MYCIKKLSFIIEVSSLVDMFVCLFVCLFACLHEFCPFYLLDAAFYINHLPILTNTFHKTLKKACFRINQQVLYKYWLIGDIMVN